MDNVVQNIKDQIKDNEILLFMKGSPYPVSYTHLRAHETV